MTTTTKLTKTRSTGISRTDENDRLKAIKEAITDALEAVDQARIKCLRAGQLLLEWKAELEYGIFEQNVEREIAHGRLPQISLRTARSWMQAAENVGKALAENNAIDIAAIAMPVSEILSADPEKLTEEARAWRQLWFDFADQHSLRECIAMGMGTAITRSINGKFSKGAGGSGDRKDFPLFVAVKLKDMGAHLGHWETMGADQRAEILGGLTAAILGDSLMLRERGRKEPFKYGGWPDDVCEHVMAVCKKKMKS